MGVALGSDVEVAVGVGVAVRVGKGVGVELDAGGCVSVGGRVEVGWGEGVEQPVAPSHNMNALTAKRGKWCFIRFISAFWLVDRSWVDPGEWLIEDKSRLSIVCHGQLSGRHNGNGYPVTAFFFPSSFVRAYVRILTE